ncbi:MAG: glycoside hydrolase family 32 protein [Streptococcaceae bacterium]|jgi:beta-fructofuranosidase|nr:glycoside hydrolase family 32 protein [Streptococcaceae bacterium]MCH4176271.1 glycoside hydrolase family 32 protein [Streptococcaceae bacterium]
MNNFKSEIKRATEFMYQHREQVIQSKYHQIFHLSSPVGWMNDSNGFIYYDGAYHLFFQYHPFQAEWHSMYWGHAKSNDLITWEFLPVALAPSENYDLDLNGGCFSGTALYLNDLLYLFYSGVVSDENNNFIQTQCLATSDDGVNFQKSKNNPIIKKPPQGVRAKNFRDPKVWAHNGTFYMLVGISIYNKGNAVLYQSNDLLNWVELGLIIDNDEKMLGTMWECPDFFEINQQDVLIFSPLGMGDIITVYFIGKMDYETGIFQVYEQGIVDYGPDFYAPQTLLDNHNRRIMIGWQNGWDWMPKWNGFGPTSEDSWSGSMSLPREVKLYNNKLLFFPINSLTTYVKKVITQYHFKINQQIRLAFKGVSARYQLELPLDVSHNQYRLEIRNGNQITDIFKIDSKQISYSSLNNPFGKKDVSLPINNKEIHLLIISDTISFEIFEINSGQVMSVNHFNPNCDNDFFICSESPRQLDEITLFEY